jgi:NTP pyrophosphatase (non-canonical NTP hydrolase)
MDPGQKRTFEELVEITRRVNKEFEKVEQRPWGVEASTIELMKQVGDLSKRIMVFEKYYLEKRNNDPNYKTTKEDIADELADIIYSLVRISDYYGIDLEEAQIRARREELKSLGKEPNF